MGLQDAIKAGAGFTKKHFTEFIGTILVFLGGYAPYYFTEEFSIYSVIASSIVALMMLAYQENVKYHWVDQ